MKLFSFLLFSSLILACYSAVFIGTLPAKPGHENACFDYETGKFYERGVAVKWDKVPCGIKICKGSNKKGYFGVDYQTCGAIGYPKHCRLEVDLKLPYPKCCGRVICPDK